MPQQAYGAGVGRRRRVDRPRGQPQGQKTEKRRDKLSTYDKVFGFDKDIIAFFFLFFFLVEGELF